MKLSTNEPVQPSSDPITFSKSSGFLKSLFILLIVLFVPLIYRLVETSLNWVDSDNGPIETQSYYEYVNGLPFDDESYTDGQELEEMFGFTQEEMPVADIKPNDYSLPVSSIVSVCRDGEPGGENSQFYSLVSQSYFFADLAMNGKKLFLYAVLGNDPQTAGQYEYDTGLDVYHVLSHTIGNSGYEILVTRHEMDEVTGEVMGRAVRYGFEVDKGGVLHIKRLGQTRLLSSEELEVVSNVWVIDPSCF